MGKRTHRATVDAQSILLGFVLGTAWAIWVVMTLPPVPVCVLVAFFFCFVVIVLRLRWLEGVDHGLTKPSGVAWIPVACVVVALVGYGATLTIVLSRYHSEREAVHRQAEERWERALVAALPRLEKIGHLMGRGSTRDRREADVRLAALRREMPPLGKSPSPAELPAWFGRLNDFFTLATQLLAALVVVLAFNRWRSGASEAVYRTAMPVAVVAVAVGLIGTLPSLPRALAAILLAPVVAGLAGAISSLLVATMAARA